MSKIAPIGEIARHEDIYKKIFQTEATASCQSPEVEACQVYLSNCKEANLATAKCGEEQKELRSRDGRVGDLLDFEVLESQ